MSIRSDLKSARKVLRNAWHSRRTRRALAAHPPAVVPPGRIRIAVYFADTRVNLYQIRQWYAPLAELAADHPVAIITRSPGATLAIMAE